MTDPAIIELEPQRHTMQSSELDEAGKPTPVIGPERETLLFSIYDLACGSCPFNALFETLRDELEKAVWTMAESCDRCDYWTAMYLWSDDDLERLRRDHGVSVATGKWGRGHVQRKDEFGTVRYSREGGYVLASIPRDVSPHIEWRLIGHDPADHFYAAPRDSDSGRTLKRISQDPGAYQEAIERLSASELVLHDSCFELSGFGPSGDHLSIAYSPAFTREQVRRILQASYGIPYYKVSLSPAEYDLWLNGHTDFEIDLSRRVPVDQSG